MAWEVQSSGRSSQLSALRVFTQYPWGVCSATSFVTSSRTQACLTPASVVAAEVGVDVPLKAAGGHRAGRGPAALEAEAGVVGEATVVEGAGLIVRFRPVLGALQELHGAREDGIARGDAGRPKRLDREVGVGEVGPEARAGAEAARERVAGAVGG